MVDMQSHKFSLHYIQNMKKLIITGAAILFEVATFAASQTPQYRFIPLLSGYNIQITNGSSAAATIGSTNVLNTTYNGQVLYSLNTNTINGTINTNSLSPDAFKRISLVPDANGDVNANASLFVYIGNTNWIPLVTTNSVGQFFIPPAGFTNAQVTTAYVGWPLAAGNGFPNWMYPATTNYYPQESGTFSTNVVSIALYRVATVNPQGGVGSDLQSPFMLAESTAGITNTITANGTTPVGAFFPLTTTFLQGAREVYCSVWINGTNLNGGILVNQIGIVQPQP